MAVSPAAHRYRQPGGVQPASGEERLFAWAAAATTPNRFNPAASGRIAGSVAAQRTHEQGLAASGPDGTLVWMLPAAFAGVETGTAPHPFAGIPGNGRATR
jgi:hypothetical protein